MNTSVYVHFPWCLQKCPYCDFASAGIARDAVPSDAYADSVLRELDARIPGLTGHRLASVFFGGGTPSLWAPEALGRVLAGIKEAIPGDGKVEVTVECNPSSLDQRKAAALRHAGVNRLSIGVQSLDDQRLRFLGRLHTSAGALAAVAAGQREIPRVSADLMFGMPDQGAEDFLREADALLETGLQHLSAYALTVEPDTQFGALHRKGRLQLAREETFADTFERAEAHLERLGLQHYEVSNYAAPGQRSVHNLHYWQGGAYLGLGAGAVGCLHSGGADGPKGRAGRRYRNDPKPERYMAAAASGHSTEVFEEALDADDLIREALMLGLRTAEGIDTEAIGRRAQRPVAQGRAAAIARRLERGDLVQDGARLRVPKARWLRLDGIVADLF